MGPMVTVPMPWVPMVLTSDQRLVGGRDLPFSMGSAGNKLAPSWCFYKSWQTGKDKTGCVKPGWETWSLEKQRLMLKMVSRGCV